MGSHHVVLRWWTANLFSRTDPPPTTPSQGLTSMPLRRAAMGLSRRRPRRPTITPSDKARYPSAQMRPAIAQQPYPGSYTIIQPSVVVVGGCPACRVGVLEDDFTCLGVLCAIFFFPLGLLFCFALRQRRCPNCGATF
ncbi:hypothetical protein F7725_003510, partial [Dissostichus mawsoni]